MLPIVALGMGSMMLGMTSCSSDDKTNTSTGVEIKKVDGVVVNETNPLSLKVGDSSILVAKVTPEDAYIRSVTWSSSDKKVAMIDEKGIVIALSEGNAVITAMANDLSGKSGSCRVVVSKETNHRKLVSNVGGIDRYGVQLWENGPYFAEFNVGATISDYGDVKGAEWSANVYINGDNELVIVDTVKLKHWVGNYYNWGVTKDQSLLTDKGRWPLDDELAGITNISGHAIINNNDTLGDAATKNWGAEWRMPNNYELSGLDIIYGKVDTCWKDGINKQFRGSSIPGMCFIGKGDYKNDTIFFPAAGNCNSGNFYGVGAYGYSWSSVPRSGGNAWRLYFYSGNANMYYSYRGSGLSVRAVCAKN